MRGSAIVTEAAVAALCAVLAIGMPPAAAQQPGKGEDESAALVAEGRRVLERGSLDEAARALDQAIALNPRRIEAYVLRAAIHLTRKQYSDGIALTRRARSLAPNSDDVLGMLGMLLMLDGKAAEGVPLLEHVVERVPRRYDAQGALARHYIGLRRWDQAIAALEAYLTARPAQLATSDPMYRIDLANAYLRAGQPTRARTLFAAALEQRPTDVRARLGVAWATAAVDCRKARPMLGELTRLARRYPEVWLVDGQCALAMGDTRAAIRLGNRYVEVAGKTAASGHALVGEAHAARGDLAAAQAELARARKLEPRRRRWAVRLAHMARLGGDPSRAVAELDAIGQPADPAADPDWWAELGDALIATGQARTVAARLAPVAPQVPRHAGVRTVLGDALVRTGDAAGAVSWLEAAEAIRSTARSRGLLARALETVAAGQIEAGELRAAEASLARADAARPSPSIGRNLGVVRLALERPAEATAPLERSVRAEPNAITWMLLGRARAAAGDRPAARNAYDRAANGARGEQAIEVAIDSAAFELAAGEPSAALSALERAQGQEEGAEAGLATRYRRALVVARHAAGLSALRSGDPDRAVKLLEAADTGAAGGAGARAIKCDLALATVATGKRVAALRRLRQLGNGPCPFPAPASTQAVPILIAFTEGLTARHAGRALDRLDSLEARSTGAARQLLATAVRVVAINAADQAYRAGRIAQARRYLARASRVEGQAAADELAHNIAVLDVEDGRLAAARASLERLSARFPEALVNLGVAQERQGNPEKALDLWRKARRAGVRFAPLADWIAAKEQLYGEGGSGP